VRRSNAQSAYLMTDEQNLENRPILTRTQMAAQFREIGVQPGHTVMLHTSLKALGSWIPGGVEAVLLALLDVLGADGTLMMPAQSSNNSDPSIWIAPPVPEAWWSVIRAEMPPYNPQTTQTSGIGVLAEYFRSYPGTLRSDHPNLSFSARGKHAAHILASQPYDAPFGEDSPLGRFVRLDGMILLLGVGHDRNTTLHLAEHRAEWPSKAGVIQGAAVMLDDLRQWVALDEAVDYASDDFDQIGAEYERQIGYEPGKIGRADTRYLRAAPMVKFAARWIATNRG